MPRGLNVENGHHPDREMLLHVAMEEPEAWVLDTGAEMSTSIKEAARRSAVRSGLLAPEESDAPFEDVFKKPLNG